MTVESWGIGKPDFSARSYPARTEIGEDRQTAIFMTAALVVPGSSTLTIPIIYTVATGKVFTLGYGKITFAHDSIWETSLLKDGVDYCMMFQPEFWTVTPTDLAGIQWLAGETIGGKIINTLPIPVGIKFAIGGFLNDV